MGKSEDKAERRLEKARRKLEKAKRKLAEAEARRSDKEAETDALAAEMEAEAARMEAEAARMEEAAGALAAGTDGGGKLIVAETNGRTTMTLPPEVAELFKAAGKGWQQKAEAAMALWLDEASVIIRRDGMDGFKRTLKQKTEAAKAEARSGRTEEKVERFVKTAMNTVGRDIAQAALGAALAAFGDPNARKHGDEPRKDSESDAAKKPAPEQAAAEPSPKPAPKPKPKPKAKKAAAPARRTRATTRRKAAAKPEPKAK